jgi:cytochrome o ubiquinol oxidase subunit 2
MKPRLQRRLARRASEAFKALRFSRWMFVCSVALMLCACGGPTHLSFLDPQGPVASMQRTHFLEMLALLAIFVAGPIFLLIPFFAWRYRLSAKSSRYTPKWNFFLPLEIAAWSGPVIIVALLAVLVWRSTHALDPYRPIASSQPPLRVQVIGYDWKWLFVYPDQGIASIGMLALPVGRPLSMQLTSATVMQSLEIPSLGSQIYAMGGMVTQLNLQADQPGRFLGENTMYNGDGFHQQHFTAVAMTPADFKTWVNKVHAHGIALDAENLKRLSRPGTRSELIVALPSAASMDGNVYFNSVSKDLFSTIVQATGSGMPMASSSLSKRADAVATDVQPAAHASSQSQP